MAISRGSLALVHISLVGPNLLINIQSLKEQLLYLDPMEVPSVKRMKGGALNRKEGSRKEGLSRSGIKKRKAVDKMAISVFLLR